MLIYFLFGAFKDFAQRAGVPHMLTRYSIVLPTLTAGLVFIFLYLRKSKTSFSRFSKYLATLLLAVAGIEIAFLAINLVHKPTTDYGDKNHNLIQNTVVPPQATKPNIFWIVLDAYSSSETLKSKWHFNNPLDTQLQKKRFFVHRSAISPYNYTHFSLSSTLDMQYLCCLKNGSRVDFRDMAIGSKTLFDNNTITFLKANGYDFYNYSVFDMKDHAAKPYIKFKLDRSLLITYTTLSSAIERDIWWNVRNFISGDLNGVHQTAKHDLKRSADRQCIMIRQSEKLIEESVKHVRPSMYMFHYMITHDPFVFNADGSFYEKARFNSRDGYLSSIQYANKVVNDITDLILSTNKDKNFVIIIQSDHGFRYGEDEPEFEKESCKIFYAVYCSDGIYNEWKSNTSSINTFRLVFNKYFRTAYPMLPAHPNVLRYAQEK
jgi:hypothetical protein